MQAAAQAFFSRAGVAKSSLLQHVRVFNPALRQPLVFSRSESSVSPARIEEHGFENTTIADVLTSKGKGADGSWLWCTVQDTVYDAVQSMTQHNVGALVVVKPGQQKSIAGIITERDYLRKIIVQGRSSKSTKVGDIMTEENKLITVTPDTKVLRAMQLMTGTTYSSSYSSSSSPQLPASDLTAAILNSRTPDQALQLFTSAVKHNRKSPLKNLRHYSAVIHVLTGAGVYTPARCLIKGLIQSFLKSHDPKRACSLIFGALNRLESSRFTSNVFGTLIIALCEVGLVEEALWVRRKIDVLPARQACNALMNGLVREGRFDSMWAIYTL